jgi:hypothetical protein
MFGPARFGWLKQAVLPGTHQSLPYIYRQGRPVFEHGTTLCYWAEPHSRHIPLFHGQEQHKLHLHCGKIIEATRQFMDSRM